MQRDFLPIVGLILVLTTAVFPQELQVCNFESENRAGSIDTPPPPPASTNADASYTGTIRVYLVEPTSRWVDAQGQNYAYGLLDFPVVSNFTRLDGEVIYRSSDWDAQMTTFSQISESNIMAIAVVFRAQTVITDADPPNAYYFQARYADAVAAVKPGEISRNEATPPYNHSIFIEESTAYG